MFSRSLKYAFLIFFLTAPVVMAQEKLKIFPLKNRMMEEVIPIIRPLLGRNESVTGMRQQLIVRASPRKLREIKNLLGKIDGQLKNLRITVKQGLRSQLNELEARINGQIPIGDSGRVVINPGEKEGGIIVEGQLGGGMVRGRISEREAFSSIPAVMWWAVSTMTTVGYGDVYPITTLEIFFGGFISMLGLGTFGLPVGIIAYGFVEELHKQKMRPLQCPHCGKEVHAPIERRNLPR